MRCLQTARPLVPGRRVDQRAGDARRHGRQQLLRLALDPLRQHGAQRAARSTRCSRRRASATSAPCSDDLARCDAPPGYRELVSAIRAHCRSAKPKRSSTRFPKVLRRVGGYNLDMVSRRRAHNMAHLLVGSEGTLAYSEAPAPEALAAAAAQDARRLPLPDVLSRDGGDAAHRQARTRRRSSWSIAR